MQQLLDFAMRAVAAGNFAAAEIACRDLLDFEPRDAAALHLLGFIAAKVGARDPSIAYFQAALDIEPENDRIRENLAAARNMQLPPPPRHDRYLLIKSWGFGFWADMVQVLGSLLLAEATGRIPVTYWGADSLFSDKSGQDAFTHYFEPVSGVSLQQLVGMRNASFFPPRWNSGNLIQTGVSKWEGKGSRAGAVYFLNRAETIAVSDFHIGAIDVAPWLPASHPMHGKALEEIYRYLTTQYLRPHADVMAACNAFFDSHLAGAPFVAVHMRGSDKSLEDTDLQATHRALLSALNGVDPSWRIFLMTDDTHCLAQMKQIYGPRLVATDCQRTGTTEGVHYRPDTDPVRAGREVMVDTYLALRAERFIGNGLSNISAMIAMMKQWEPGACTLIGRSHLTQRHLRLYQIPTFAQEEL
jgi:protein O-GlcNAc transferase